MIRVFLAKLGDPYFIRLGGRRFLDTHLGKGSARDPTVRPTLRIYFCWDEDKRRVVIGHMPSHLPTSYVPEEPPMASKLTRVKAREKEARGAQAQAAPRARRQPVFQEG